MEKKQFKTDLEKYEYLSKSYNILFYKNLEYAFFELPVISDTSSLIDDINPFMKTIDFINKNVLEKCIDKPNKPIGSFDIMPLEKDGIKIQAIEIPFAEYELQSKYVALVVKSGYQKVFYAAEFYESTNQFGLCKSTRDGHFALNINFGHDDTMDDFVEAVYQDYSKSIKNK